MAAQILTISRIYLLQLKSWLFTYLLHTLAYPLGLAFFIRVIGAEIPSERLAAGAVVFSLSTTCINFASYWAIMDRMQGRIEFIRTMPASMLSYYMAIILVAAMQALFNVHVLIFVLAISGLIFHFSPYVTILTTISALAFAAMGVFIGTKARDIHQGSLIMNLAGTGMVFLCPIFYPISKLPPVLAELASVMPHTLLFRAYLTLMR